MDVGLISVHESNVVTDARSRKKKMDIMLY